MRPRYSIVATLLAVIAAFVIMPMARGEGSVDETRFALRQEFLRMINRDRQQFGLAPVALDPWTSNVADVYCRVQILNGTTGHFSTDGLAPYTRYSLAGGNDGVSENAAAWSATYKFSERALYEMVRRSEEAMMAEVAPHDGHRRTILDPAATHVGLGFAWDKGEFRLTQEFIRRYVAWTHPLPRSASPGDRVIAMGRPVAGFDVEAISVHHEALPHPISAITANLIDTYSLPDQRRDYLPQLGSHFDRARDGSMREVHEAYSDGRHGDFPLDAAGNFSFAVPFPDGPGIYTVVVWVHRHGEKTSIAASNVSIRVIGDAAGDWTPLRAGTR